MLLPEANPERTPFSHVLLALLVASGCHATEPAEEPTGSPHAVEDSTGPSLVARGRELWSAGDVDGALEAFEQAAGLESTEAETRVEALRWSAHAHIVRGDPEAALPVFQRARALAPDDPWLCYGEGSAWSTMGELERAEGCYGDAIARDPTHVKALQWRGETRLLLHDGEGAVADFTRAVEALDAAAEVDLEAWGGNRRELLSMTLALRIEALDSLGRVEEADRDRQRREQLLRGP
jgi:tetratricopeptide (TPR) repeat protein